MADRKPSVWVSLVTLLAGFLVLGGMGWYGVNALTEPLPKFDAQDGNKCSESEITRKTEVRRKEITVSVYNAGARKGFAGKTQERLEAAGFKVGELGNAPKGVKLKQSVVYTTSSELAPARLVALSLGPKVKVERTDEDYGPGVDAFIGSEQRRLNGKAPRKIKLDAPDETCIKVK